MSKFIKGIFVCLAILGYFQYNRVFQPDKEIVLHHYEHCKIVNSTGSFLDFAYYDNDIIVAEDNLMQLFEEGPRGLSNGRLLLIKNTEHADPELQEIIIRNFPSDVGFHPFAIDFIKPNSLYVLNHAFHEGGTRVEIFNLTENTATYFNYFTFDSDLQGIFGDFIVDNDHEAYFTQYSPIPMPLDGGPMPITHYLLNLLSDIFQTANTYVFHCKFESNSTADCVPLPNTQSVSSTGITKNKFGDYYITYGSIDYNWISQYKKDSNSLIEINKLGLRDRTERVLYDHKTQRVYGAALPYVFEAWGNGAVAGGAVEIKNWEHKGGLSYRRLYMQEKEYKGASCAVRAGDYILTGSYLEKGAYLCPIYAPKN